MSNPPNLYLSYQLPTGEYQELPLVENQEITIGRFKTSTIKLSLPSVSRQHAKIFYENGSFWIKDLGSSNGSYINKEQVHHAKISLGDLVQCGEFAMMVKNRNQLSAKPSAMMPIDQYSSLPPVNQSPVSLKVVPSYQTNQSPLPFNTTTSAQNSAIPQPPKFVHQNENSINPQSHTAKPNQLQSVNLKPIQQAPQQTVQPVQNSQNRVPAFQPIQQPHAPTKSQQIENPNTNPQKPALIHAPTQVPVSQVSQTPKSPIIDHKPTFVSPSSLNQATPKAVHLPNQSSINQTHQPQNQNSIKSLTPVTPNQPQGMKSLEFPFDTPTKEANLPVQASAITPPKFVPSNSIKNEVNEPKSDLKTQQINQQLKDQITLIEKERDTLKTLVSQKDELLENTKTQLKNTHEQHQAILQYQKVFEDQNDLLQKRLLQAEHDHDIHLQQIEKLNQEINQLRQQNEDLIVMKEDYFSAKTQIAQMEFEKKDDFIRLEQDFNDLQVAHQELLQQKEQLKKLNENLHKQMQENDIQNEHILQTNKELFQQVESRSILIKEKDSLLEAMQIEINEIQSQLSLKETEKQELSEEVNHLKSQIDEWSHKSQETSQEQNGLSIMLSTEIESALMMEITRMEQHKQEMLNLRSKIKHLSQDTNHVITAQVPVFQKPSVQELIVMLQQSIKQNRMIQQNTNAHHLALDAIDQLSKLLLSSHQPINHRNTDKMLEKNREIDMNNNKEHKETDKTDSSVSRPKTWKGII
jgi:hypothetical protein